MRKAAKQIAVTAVLLLALCIVFRLVFFNQFSVYAPLPEPSAGSADIRPRVERPEVLRAGEAEIRPGYMRIPVYPESAGETDFYPDANAESAKTSMISAARFREGQRLQEAFGAIARIVP